MARRGRKRAAPGPPQPQLLTSRFDILGRPWSAQGPFWAPGGSPKCSKIDMARLARHPGAPRWAKRLSKGGSQNGVEKVIEKGSQNDGYCEVKNLQKYCKVLQNQGFEGFGKVSKTTTDNRSRNGFPKYQKWSHWRPWAGQGSTLSPLWVDLDGSPKMGRFLKCPWGAKKSMDVSPGAGRGRKKAPGRSAGESSLAKWLLGLASRARQGLIKINQ